MNTVDLVQHVELDDISCTQFSAKRKLRPNDLLVDEEFGEIGLKVFPVNWDSIIEILFRASVETSDADLLTVFSIRYIRPGDEEIPEEVRQDFIERVAVMAVMPYIREALQAGAQRLSVPIPLIPILRQGEFHLTAHDSTQG